MEKSLCWTCAASRSTGLVGSNLQPLHNASFQCKLSIRDKHLIFLKSARPHRKIDHWLPVDLEQTLIKQSVPCVSLCGANSTSQQAGSHFSTPWCGCVTCCAHLDAVQTLLSSRSRSAGMTPSKLQRTWLFLPSFYNETTLKRGSVAVQGRECPLLSPCSSTPSLLPPRALKRRLCLEPFL